MAASEIWVNVFFYAFAAMALAGALAVAFSRNIVRSAFALLALLFSTAALYALMKADFLAAVQVLVYVGGILVLIMFAIMLTHKITDVNVSNESAPGPAALFACLCLFLSLLVVIFSTVRWDRGPETISAKSGDVALSLRQFQGDGRTGLQRGGTTHEERVVLSVEAAQPPASAVAEIQVAAVPGWKDPKTYSAPLGTEEIRFDVRDLPEGAMHWRVRLVGAGPWSRPDEDGAVDFQVAKGVTRPAGRALMGRHLLAFEVVSVLLLAALVGAAFLARKEVKE